MEFKIVREEKKNKKTNLFEFRFTFMENDADDFTTEVVSIPEEKLEDPTYKAELEKFITHINECMRMDSSGRGGIDSIEEFYNRYNKVEGWSSYCANIYEDYYDSSDPDAVLEPEENYNEEWGYYIPTDTYGTFYNSYYEAKMVYFDNNGDEYPVSIED